MAKSNSTREIKMLRPKSRQSPQKAINPNKEIKWKKSPGWFQHLKLKFQVLGIIQAAGFIQRNSPKKEHFNWIFAIPKPQLQFHCPEFNFPCSQLGIFKIFPTTSRFSRLNLRSPNVSSCLKSSLKTLKTIQQNAIMYTSTLSKRVTSGGRTISTRIVNDWEITCYRLIPLRAFSKVWGFVHSVHLPVFLRKPFLSWYSKTFGCNLAEAEFEDLAHYQNLSTFFRRSLKSGLRPIDQRSSIVFPSDGTILALGPIEENGRVEHVKGVSYSLNGFFGSLPMNIMRKEEEPKCLYHCVVYLAPGDYHRFNSPVDWKVNFRRHFAGELFSVNPKFVEWISDLFSLNERVIYFGEWEHGFFSMTCIGATNVGSICVYNDTDLITNTIGMKKNSKKEQSFPVPFEYQKGDDFGEFNLGSTIVMIFEAPVMAKFSPQVGDQIKLGQSLY